MIIKHECRKLVKSQRIKIGLKLCKKKKNLDTMATIIIPLIKLPRLQPGP